MNAMYRVGRFVMMDTSWPAYESSFRFLVRAPAALS